MNFLLWELCIRKHEPSNFFLQIINNAHAMVSDAFNCNFFLYPDLSNWAMADNYNLLRYGAIACYSGTAETGSAWVWTKYVQKQKGTDI